MIEEAAAVLTGDVEEEAVAVAVAGAGAGAGAGVTTEDGGAEGTKIPLRSQSAEPPGPSKADSAMPWPVLVLW